jgi:HJR/Mrr/RecB family endonuclease
MTRVTILLLLVLNIFTHWAQVNNSNTNVVSPFPEKADDIQPGSTDAISSSALLKSYLHQRTTATNKLDKSISSTNQLKLDLIVDELAASHGQTFEYYYAAYLNTNRHPDSFYLLQKAAEVYPNNELLNRDFIFHYEVTNDLGKRNVYIKKLHETNTVEAGIMEYNYNVLMSVPKNGILLTYGSDDTYPIYIWQNIKKVRTDVIVINIEMLGYEAYRNAKSKEYGLSITWKQNIINTAEHLMKSNLDKSVCLGHTVSQTLLQRNKEMLYVTGLTYQYAEKPIENISITENNVALFKTTELKKTAAYSTLGKLNANYLVPYITLLEHYKATDQTAKAADMKSLILKIAQQQGNDFEQKINQYLKTHGW